MNRFAGMSMLATAGLVAMALVSPGTAGPSLAADTGFQFVSAWGTVGAAGGQFNALHELDVAANGQVFTVETGNQRVQTFSAGGVFRWLWGNPGPAGSSAVGQFDGPQDVAVGSDSRVYVADTGNHRIQWFTPEGVPGGSWGSEGTGNGQFDVPADLAAAPDGTVYVADFNTGRIQRFTKDGAFLSAWGSDGTGPGQFSWMTGISVGPDGTVYVVEQENHRVQHFSAAGSLLGAWGVEGSGNGQFLSPSAIDVGPDGRVFVADKERDDVQVFGPAGAYLERFGGSGTGEGQFEIPTGVAVSGSGIVYVADNNQERVQRFGRFDATTDSDGDALPDQWELLGYDRGDDGTIDVALPAMGSDPNHKDVFVEIDWMTNHHLDNAAIRQVVTSFAQSPVDNPDGRSGITLHVDNGSDSIMTGNRTWGTLSDSDQFTHVRALGWGSTAYSWTSFDNMKRQGFAAARRPIFHYVVSAHKYDDTTSSGISRGIGGSDLIVSLGSFCAAGSDCSGTTDQQAGTFMHELGHNLGLRHGGGDHVNRKPNFLSVMNYAFQMSGLTRDGTGGVFDYSMFPGGGEVLADLNESSLDESLGLGGSGTLLTRYTTTWRCGSSWQTGPVTGTLDLDCDGTPSHSARVDLNGDGQFSTLAPWNDWSHIVFDGGMVGDSAGEPLPSRTPVIEPGKRVLMQTARVMSPDHRAPSVRMRGLRHSRLTVKARDNVALDRVIVTLDGRTRQYRAMDRTTQTVRIRLKPGRSGLARHRVKASALDAAGNSSKVVRITTGRR